MNDTEFQLVSRRKSRKSKQQQQHFPSVPHPGHLSPSASYLSSDQCKEKIETCKDELKLSAFWKDFFSLLLHTVTCDQHTCNKHKEDDQPVDANVKQFGEVVVYGIGSLLNSSIARYQFALALLLVEGLCGTCYAYDPVLTPTERSLIQTYGISVLERNEECKRRAVKKKSLFLMLHCSKSMYNNLLWSNWGVENLVNVCVIGNCFSSYEGRIVARELEATSRYLAHIIPHTTEHKVNNSFRFDDIFNDTAVHTFHSSRLKLVPHELWLNCDEPQTDTSDVEIISKEQVP